MNKFIGIFLLVLSVLSCKNDEVEPQSADQQIVEWLDANNVTGTEADGGIYYYQEAVNATGALVTTGAVLAIYYNLYNLDNELLFSHQPSDGDSLLLRHGAASVFPVGLDIGLSYMREGEVFSFIIPPDLAYANLSSNLLPTSNPVRIQVELVAVTEESTVFQQELDDIDQYIITNELNNLDLNPIDPVSFFSSGLRYKRLTEGTDGTPINGNLVSVEYTANYLTSENEFDSATRFEWIFGSDEPRELIPAFELGVSLMEINERALFLSPSSQAYRESAFVMPINIADELVNLNIIPEYAAKIPPYTSITFTITRQR